MTSSRPAPAPVNQRIAYVVSQYPASSHTFIRREVDSLRRHGVDLRTYSIRKPAPAELKAPEDRASFAETRFVLPLGMGALLAAHVGALATRPLAWAGLLRLALRHRAPGAKAMLWALFHFAEAVVLARMLRADGITHVHNHFANAGATVGMMAARFAGLPWSLTLHGISETDYPAGLTLGAKLEAAEFAACVSWFGRAQAMRVTAPAHWHKFTVVRCGLDLPALPAAPAREGPRREIVCVARLSPEKGHLGLLEAIAPLDATLTLVGDGPMLAEIEAAVAAAGLTARVRFAGRLDEAATLAAIARADLLVLPSFMEGLPIVLMEAMAIGVPVIGSRVAGVPELIEDGVEGLLFRPGDWADLRRAIARVLDEPGLGERLAAAARAKVHGEFDIRAAVRPLARRFGRD
ncbi:glycosyltransferase involved in cell wall biosynthesis [Sphingomonas sp. BE138]|uniref:glycosyltransferase family 4 protein n=1 Tax=Sphingomonas sp. BE138 TaxID=2817845 RepID=UPI002860D0BD|nr:glycosyltransferase family 4 protein [Sphingomonas sp. BE138]MDR6788468.1 glycosyltransferase involved in cell wall biosynthesis [Sphingomonas sp. BE138]